MFKKSLPLKEFKKIKDWTELFDKFCCDVKDEDILEDYSDLLETHFPAFLEGFESDHDGGYSTDGLNTRLSSVDQYDDIRMVIVSQDRGESIAIQVETRLKGRVNNMFTYAVISNYGVSFVPKP